MRWLTTEREMALTDRGLRSQLASRLHFELRVFLRKRRWLIRSSQVIRAWWILGPLSQCVVRYYQRRKHDRLLAVDTRTGGSSSKDS
jgi:hypothetical protein